jgi:hypothetical protein
MSFRNIVFSLLLASFYYSSIFADDLQDFKSDILNSKYEDAMLVYSRNINGEETIPFQKHIYQSVLGLMKKDITKAKKLLDAYLDIEFNDSFGLYILSKIEYSYKNYFKSLEILYKLENSYLEENFSANVRISINQTVDLYLQTLYKKRDINKLIESIQVFSQYGDKLSTNKSKESLLNLSSKYTQEKDYVKSLNILNLLQEYQNTDILDNSIRLSIEKIEKLKQKIKKEKEKQKLKKDDKTKG